MELDFVEAGVLDAVEFDQCNEVADLEAETCGLCMEVVVDRGLLDCCQHWFCFACIDNWSTITNLCPLCQNEFQLITCVPVYDTVGNNKFEEELFPREDDWCVEGNNNTLSFPSYYIDENAVVCLDGDNCKIRAGSSSAEGDVSLDTSIACDSCDIWYHAFCVGFDPEDTSESTWLCPRCTNELQGGTGTSYTDYGDSSCQENTTSLVENSSGGKLSVSVADTGETAIVVSMVTGDHSIQGCNVPSPTIQDTKCKTETVEGSSEFEGDKVKEAPMLESGKSIPSLESEDLGSSLSMGESFGFPHSIASSKLMENSDLHVQVDGMVTSGTGNGLVEEVPSQILSDKTLVKDDQSIVDSQNTIVKTNAAKRRHADASDDNEGSRAKRKKVKARHAKRSMPNGKVSPEEFSTLSPRDDMQPNGETSPDIMSIVQGSEAKPPKASSLRVKKIMKRPIEDKESSTALEKLRQEIREAVRNRSAEESENLFDPTLLAAFRAVVTGPKAESVTKLSPLALKARKSLLHKGKVRESLTKKIYGNSNGRRKRAWDRDCEVEFWKYRCKKTMRPEKIDTLKSVLSLLRNGSECSGAIKEPEQSPADSILTRLYLADTSVLPRKDGIKPLSNCEDATKPDQKKAQNIPGNSANRSLAATSVEASARGSNSGFSASSITKDRASSKTPIKRAEGSVPYSIGASKGNANPKKEAKEIGGDARVDKRKWALELLARKTTSAGKGASDGDGDAALLKGNYPLLAQLPVDRRPTLAPCRHNKIPLFVRQTQLYRLTEHFLKKANLSSLVRSAETELAVADAVNIEKKVADRSSSKLVYMNLCSQELLHRSGNSQSNDTPMEANPSSTLQGASSEHSQEEVADKLSDPEVEAALRATGLLSDSPVGSPNRTTVSEIDNEQIIHLREDEPENILELDSNPELDIYGDFEYDLGDEDYVGASTIQVPVVQPEEGEAKMKVVFSSLHSEKSTDAVESTSSELVGNESSLPENTDPSKRTVLEADVGEKCCEPDKVLSGEGDEEPSAAECEELYGPEKEPVIHNYAEGASELDRAVKQSGASSSDEKSTVGREFHGDTQSIDNRNEGESEEKAGTNVDKHSDGVNYVTKKVETYIKEHIRPLCKSGVISTGQYRWAVSKTTDKVMRYHSNSKTANFLIKEGEKVKRLAEQYVEAAQKRPKGDS